LQILQWHSIAAKLKPVQPPVPTGWQNTISLYALRKYWEILEFTLLEKSNSENNDYLNLVKHKTSWFLRVNNCWSETNTCWPPCFFWFGWFSSTQRTGVWYTTGWRSLTSCKTLKNSLFNKFQKPEQSFICWSRVPRILKSLRGKNTLWKKITKKFL